MKTPTKTSRKNPEPESGDLRSMDDDPVVQGILTAISQKRLKPGSKLGEDQLAQAFGTTRIHVRQALAHLASRRIVKQFANRGTFISKPTWEEAEAIIETRRIIEAAATTAAIERLDDKAIARIKTHMVEESGHDRSDRWASLSLTADFHVLIAELSGNAVLLDIAKELMLRTSLAIATFEIPGSEDCSPDAHPHIVDLILARDTKGALHAMRHHLDEIENRIRPRPAEEEPEDIATIFRKIGVAPVRRRRA